MVDIANDAGLKDVTAIPEAELVGKNSPAEQSDEYSGKIKVINNITGEVLEREYKSIHEAKNLLQEVAASESAFKRAKEKVKAQIERFMSSYDEYEFADGDMASWVAPQRHSISFTDVAEALGEDVAALFSDVNLGKLKDYLQECVDRKEMTYDQKDEILSKAVVTPGKAFVKLGKAKR